MQEDLEKTGGMEGMSIEEMFLGIQESYEAAQQRAQEENRAFARTEFFRMDKLGVYRLRVLPLAPNPDGTVSRPGYEFPVHQLLLELEKPTTGNKPQKMYVTVTRATDAGYSVDPIETYRRLAVMRAKESGDEKLAEKIDGGSFGGGLKYSYGHCLYIFDLNEHGKGIQMMTLSHAQFKDLDERKFKLWQKKLQKNPTYPCPISSVRNAYPVEIEKRKNGSKTEYVISIDNESEPISLTREELTALMSAPRIPDIIYRYTRYHLGATVEFLKQCDALYGMALMGTEDMKAVIKTLEGELPKEDTSTFSFDRRTKDNKENGQNGSGRISYDDLSDRYEELHRLSIGDRTEEGQELRSLIRAYIEQEGLDVRITRSTPNSELLDMIYDEIMGPEPESGDEADSGEETMPEDEPQPAERTERPRRRR
ncbi:hypothetical protein [uncultured Duncaniella sp.]|uniref:hypothetical protein n=1 Tax=uncultured Duncaniella sp. TaxID=2768039 RepID=UPI0025A9AB4A|nr:hypothetical protein [uncultured Duncaniella sp.]